ncbi:hypothetical protein G6F22_022067 [Rhizopus arrhizus]|nr:hypothetical protein G6F22_022067 [Rhizopus arrhizus]
MAQPGERSPAGVTAAGNANSRAGARLYRERIVRRISGSACPAGSTAGGPARCARRPSRGIAPRRSPASAGPGRPCPRHTARGRP